MIGHGFWQRQFAARGDVLGQTLEIGANKYTVVGVAPAGFTGTELGDVDVAARDCRGGSSLCEGTELGDLVEFHVAPRHRARETRRRHAARRCAGHGVVSVVEPAAHGEPVGQGARRRRLGGRCARIDHSGSSTVGLWVGRSVGRSEGEQAARRGRDRGAAHCLCERRESASRTRTRSTARDGRAPGTRRRTAAVSRSAAGRGDGARTAWRGRRVDRCRRRVARGSRVAPRRRSVDRHVDQRPSVAVYRRHRAADGRAHVARACARGEPQRSQFDAQGGRARRVGQSITDTIGAARCSSRTRDCAVGRLRPVHTQPAERRGARPRARHRARVDRADERGQYDERRGTTPLRRLRAPREAAPWRDVECRHDWRAIRIELGDADFSRRPRNADGAAKQRVSVRGDARVFRRARRPPAVWTPLERRRSTGHCARGGSERGDGASVLAGAESDRRVREGGRRLDALHHSRWRRLEHTSPESDRRVGGADLSPTRPTPGRDDEKRRELFRLHTGSSARSADAAMLAEPLRRAMQSAGPSMAAATMCGACDRCSTVRRERGRSARGCSPRLVRWRSCSPPWACSASSRSRSANACTS